MIRYDKILATYTLAELFEINEVTEDQVLEFLVKEEFITLPDIIPVDAYDD